MRSIQAIGMSLVAILVLADTVSAQSLRDGFANAELNLMKKSLFVNVELNIK